MSNEEYIKQLSTYDFAQFLCGLNDGCIECQAIDKCYRGHNGMIDWLREEKQDDN